MLCPFAQGWKFDRGFQTLRINSQQHAKTCHRVCKRTQFVAFLIQQCLELLVNNVASVCTLLKNIEFKSCSYIYYTFCISHLRKYFFIFSITVIFALRFRIVVWNSVSTFLNSSLSADWGNRLKVLSWPITSFKPLTDVSETLGNELNRLKKLQNGR